MDEAGFTLIEVLVSIAITSLILVVMGFAITQSLTNSTSTTHSIDRATMSNFASRYFAEDIASSTGTPTAHTTLNTNPPCGAGKTVIDIPNASTGGVTISYIVVGSGTGPRTLYRRTCGTAGATVAQQQLGQTNDIFTPSSSCVAASGVCSLTITWSTPVRSFTVSGTQRRISG